MLFDISDGFPYESAVNEMGKRIRDRSRGVASAIGTVDRTRRTRRIDYTAFAKARVELGPIEEVGDMREVLRRSGYTHLTGRDRKRISIGDASEARVRAAYWNTSRAYEKRV